MQVARLINFTTIAQSAYKHKALAEQHVSNILESTICCTILYYHDEAMTWKRFPYYYPFARGIQRRNKNIDIPFVLYESQYVNGDFIYFFYGWEPVDYNVRDYFQRIC